MANCRKMHTEPIDLDYCLKAFTSEERLEEKYHCSSCRELRAATKKLQIWRLPPILVIITVQPKKLEKYISNFSFSDHTFKTFRQRQRQVGKDAESGEFPVQGL